MPCHRCRAAPPDPSLRPRLTILRYEGSVPDLARFPPNRAATPDTWAALLTIGGPSFVARHAVEGATVLYLITKAALSGVIVAAVSEIARRYPGWGGLVASLPLTSLLAMIWLYRDSHDPARVAALSASTIWFIIPSVPLFIALPMLIRSGLGFWASLAIVVAGTLALYALMFWAAPKLGLKL